MSNKIRLLQYGNLTNNSDAPFLEQAVKVDGIHKDSAKYLSKLSVDIWKEVYKKIIDEVQPISDKEGGKHKITFDVYCYYE
ncbi:hypothetical protein [Isorropodon fossajaponicum symbiont]|uniref:hypothetical protein n=1 Tax=Isorropodon fossajaponicum symbiont TaxID=883811 RepID=UPI001CED5DBC|nr:hypothetical protein [Isorropodon fossajaponicum symbiont]